MEKPLNIQSLKKEHIKNLLKRFIKTQPNELLQEILNIRWTYRIWQKRILVYDSNGHTHYKVKIFRRSKVPRKAWKWALAVRWIIKKKLKARISRIFKRTRRPYPRKWWKKKSRRWKWVQSSLWLVKRKGLIMAQRRYRRLFVWAKRKRTNSWKHWRNFAFFFKRQLRLKKKRRGWKKLVLRVKNVHKTKFYFKWFLIKRYRLRKIAPLRRLVLSAKKLRGSRLMNLFFFLELQLGIICVRMHFFWSLVKARAWIQRGCVFVNGSSVTKVVHRAKIQDLLSLALTRRIWKRLFGRSRSVKKKHMLKFRAFNCTEISLFCLAGILYLLPYRFKNIKYIIKRRRKIWIRASAFNFLMNSFK